MKELAMNPLKLVSTKAKKVEKTQTKSAIVLRWDESTGRLYLNVDGQWKSVTLKSCFPWSGNLGNYSLRNSQNEELGFVEKMQSLDEDSQKALLSSQKESGFYFEVLEIVRITEEFELRFWEVKTAQGLRRFQTRLTDWPRQLGESFYIIQDVQKDLFVIEDISKLNDSSKKLFWPFMDS